MGNNLCRGSSADRNHQGIIAGSYTPNPMASSSNQGSSSRNIPSAPRHQTTGRTELSTLNAQLQNLAAESEKRMQIAQMLLDAGNNWETDHRTFERQAENIILSTPHVGLYLRGFLSPHRMLIALDPLTRTRRLQTLVIDASGQDKVTPVLIDVLRCTARNNPQLRDFQLDISGNGLTEADIDRLDEITNLKILDISQNPLGHRTGSILRNLRSLEALNVSHTNLGLEASPGFSGINELSSLTGLTALSLDSSHAKTASINQLTTLTRLVEFSGADNNLDEGVVRPLKALPNLTSVDLSGNRISGAFLRSQFLGTRVSDLKY